MVGGVLWQALQVDCSICSEYSHTGAILVISPCAEVHAVTLTCCHCWCESWSTWVCRIFTFAIRESSSTAEKTRLPINCVITRPRPLLSRHPVTSNWTLLPSFFSTLTSVAGKSSALPAGLPAVAVRAFSPNENSVVASDGVSPWRWSCLNRSRKPLLISGL
ncbi:hypothetical protein D3C73_1300080 [compost metagenome]